MSRAYHSLPASSNDGARRGQSQARQLAVASLSDCETGPGGAGGWRQTLRVPVSEGRGCSLNWEGIQRAQPPICCADVMATGVRCLNPMPA